MLFFFLKAGGGLLNRFMRTTTPALPEGYMGTNVANGLKMVPGAEQFAPNSIRAVGEFLIW